MKTITIKTVMELSDAFGNTHEQEMTTNSVNVDFEDEELLKLAIKITNESMLKTIKAGCPDSAVTLVSDNLTFARVHLEEEPNISYMIYYNVKE